VDLVLTVLLVSLCYFVYLGDDVIKSFMVYGNIKYQYLLSYLFLDENEFNANERHIVLSKWLIITYYKHNLATIIYV
jgi:hypothetical protein